MIEYNQFIDELYEFFYEKWKVFSLSEFGYIAEVDFDGLNNANLDPFKVWARISHIPVIERQAAFAESDKLFTSTGIIFAEVHFPKSEVYNIPLVTKELQNFFKGKTTQNRIIFRNTSPRKLNVDETWITTSVYSEYTYDNRV